MLSLLDSAYVHTVAAPAELDAAVTRLEATPEITSATWTSGATA